MNKKLVFLLFLCVWCGKESKIISLPDDCNILTPDPNEDCFFPYPFTQFTKSENNRLTLNIPTNRIIARTDLSRINGKYDGFSPANQIFYWDPAGFSKEGLPKPEETLDTQSLIQLIEFGTGDRIPILVEPDANAEPPKQTLIIRPLLRMKPKKRYVVVIKKGLLDKEGKLLKSPDVFRELRDDTSTVVSNGKNWKKHFDEIFSFLEKQKIRREDILVSWDFPTSSDEFIIGEHLGKIKSKIKEMQNQITFSILSEKQDPYKDDDKVPQQYRTMIRKSVKGVLYLPSVQNYSDKVSAEFLLHIPNCTNQKMKILIFGHGLFGSTKEIILHPQRNIAYKMCVAEIGINWQGIDENARAKLVELVTAENAINAVWNTVDNLLQGHANFLALSLIVGREEFWKKVGVENVDIADPVYLGISNGAVQGGTFMAISELKRGILQVGGAIWTAMLERNASWNFLKSLISKDEKEIKKIIAVAQVVFDVVDPITFAPYIIKGNEQFGISPKNILVQEALYDEQVANFTTRTYVRTASIPAIEKLIEPVFGIDSKRAEGGVEGSGYIQYDTKVDKKPPEENKPLEDTQKSQVRDYEGEEIDNQFGNKFVSSHEAVRRIPKAIEQMKRFIYEGKIYQICSDSICDPD